MKLIDVLFKGPIDVIGDVHGEIAGLEALLARLGYPPGGAHPGNRRLVFVGDLVDRGPDSPAVVERVMRLVDEGAAQCVIGNHELNLLVGRRNGLNDWFFGADGEGGAPVSEAQRNRFIDFFGKLPLVLERDDLRIVHACWNERAVADFRERDGSSPGAAQAFDLDRKRIEQELEASGALSRYREENARYARHLASSSWETPLLLPAHVEVPVKRRMMNPVGIVTSGEVVAAREPFWKGRRWRMFEHRKWWEDYDGHVPVVIGHYQRNTGGSPPVSRGKREDLFRGTSPGEWLGAARKVYCVDFSNPVSKAGRGFAGKLTALRIPEWEVHHHDGTTMRLPPPGTRS